MRMAVHEDYIKIVRAVDGPLTTLDGNVQILDESFFEDDELMILAKLLYILCYLEDIDKKVSAKFQLQ